jgi:FkbM family methyltransferase
MLADRIIQQIPSSIRRPLREFYEFSKKGSLRTLLSQFIQPGTLVFDIGAHTGYYAACFVDLGARVVCVEPQPYCIQKLTRRFKNYPDLMIVEMGLAEEGGERVLHIDTRNSVTASFSEKFISQGPFKNRRWAQEIIVPVITLDDLILEYGKPVFCKIDVEGYEPNVLKGLSNAIPCISFEYTQSFLDDARNCLDLLGKLGPMRMNYAPTFDFTRLALREWIDDPRDLLVEIDNSSIEYSGDIYVKFDQAAVLGADTRR